MLSWTMLAWVGQLRQLCGKRASHNSLLQHFPADWLPPASPPFTGSGSCWIRAVHCCGLSVRGTALGSCAGFDWCPLFMHSPDSTVTVGAHVPVRAYADAVGMVPLNGRVYRTTVRDHCGAARRLDATRVLSAGTYAGRAGRLAC